METEAAIATSLNDAVALLRPALLAFARRAVGDPVVAEDLVQEALLAVAAGRAPFEGRAKLRTWLHGILAHKVADYFRARARSPEELELEALPSLGSPVGYSSPEGAAARRQALGALEAALRTLPALERLAVLSVDVEGLAHADTCNALRVQATHLRVLLHRGRHRLRKAVEDALM